MVAHYHLYSEAAAQTLVERLTIQVQVRPLAPVQVRERHRSSAHAPWTNTMVGPSAVIVTISLVDCQVAFQGSHEAPPPLVEISTNDVAMAFRPDEVLRLIRSTVEAVVGVT